MIKKVFAWGFFFALMYSAEGMSLQTGRSTRLVIPDSVTTEEGRTDWLASHYWDKFDFRDSLELLSSESTKVELVNYFDLLTKVKESVLEESVKMFIEKSCRYQASRLYFLDETEHYLFSAGSPHRNDRLYMVFLRAILVSGQVSEDEKSRYRFQLENVVKNQPGRKATDFTYLNKEGMKCKMSEIQANYLVLFFYNPDCRRCRDAEEHLMKESVLQDPSVKVLAIYPGSQTEEWLHYASRLPAAWIDGCSPEGEINNRLLYFIQSTLAIYLLDKDKQVLLKDSSPRELVDYLKRINL